MNESNRWEEFNLIVDNLELKSMEKLLLITLFRFVNAQNGYASPSRVLIKKLTQISHDKTLDKHLNSLIEKGYLERISGNGIRSKYFIIVPSKNEVPRIIVAPIKNEVGVPSKNIGIPPSKSEVQKENKKKIKENIYSSIFDFWISKNIKKHRNLTNEMKKAIDKAIKDYSESEILEAINNYGDMYNDSAYQWCNYQWGLNEFLVRKDKDGIRQIGLFLNDGSKYLNYLSWKSKNNPKEKDIGDLMEQLMANREE